jgi:hypothetical protein
MSTRDVSAVKREGASRVCTDLGGLIRQVHLLQGTTQLNHARKLFGIRKSFVDALRAGGENGLLVNGLCGMRYPVLCARPGAGRAQRQPAECADNTDYRLPPCGPVGESGEMRCFVHGRFPNGVLKQHDNIARKYVQDNVLLVRFATIGA